MARLRLITFDLDDTLWAVEPVIKQANRRLHGWLQKRAPEFTRHYSLEDLDDLKREVVARHPEWTHSVTLIRKAVLQLGLTRSGYAADQVQHLTEAAFAYFIDVRNQVRFFEGVEHCLEQLQSRFCLGALSNGNADVERVGLGSYFDFAFSAHDIGYAKPARQMFDAALAHLNVPASQVLHVGDSAQHDVLGAQAAGMHTLWVNLEASPWPENEVRPDIEVTRVVDIAPAIFAFDQKA